MSLARLKSSAGRVGQSSLARNTLWMLVSQGVRLLLQSVYFVIIARALGPEEYGRFVGAAAIVAILSPFASFGGAIFSSRTYPETEPYLMSTGAMLCS